MVAVWTGYTLANLEIGCRTVVPSPVRTLQPDQEGRSLTAISLMA